MKGQLEVAGEIRVPGDKSISHRALLFAAMANGESRIRNILTSEDIHSTAAVLRALGVSVPSLGDDIVVEGKGPEFFHSPTSDLDCGNSGTTTRLVAGMLAGCEGLSARFIGDASLSVRPMKRIAKPLTQMGARLEFELGDGLPMTVHGNKLSAIHWSSEHASAQVKGAILLAALCGEVAVSVKEPTVSRDHTERMLTARGARIEIGPEGEIVFSPSPTPLLAMETNVPADPSSAAFLVGLAALADSGELCLRDVCLNPTRTGGFDILARMGASIEWVNVRDSGGEPVGDLIVRASELRGTTVSGPDVPSAIDELPLIACVAARASGETVISGASELRVKETDRITAVVANLRAIGVDAEEQPDGMTIRGSDRKLVGKVKTYGDHRIAMAFGVLGALPGNEIEVDDRSCVSVSFPGFWDVLSKHAKVLRPTGRDVDGKMKKLVIAIDGPAASGKSSTAQWVASRLGVRHVDSGAFYRALTLLALRSGTLQEAWTDEFVLSRASQIGLAFTDVSVLPSIDGELAGVELRSESVNSSVSRVAVMPLVREWVNQKVREASLESDVVVDGRDIGTVVFPDAQLKVFLVADSRERARRRLVQSLGRVPSSQELDQELALLLARDSRDALQSAPHAESIQIDTTSLTQAEQVERIVDMVKDLRSGL